MTRNSTRHMKKDNVFIVSGGRTGTTFFGDLLSSTIDECYSVHEPDLLDGVSRRTLRAIREFGFYHMVVGRILGLTGVRNLSQKYLAGDWDIKKVDNSVRKHRQAYYNKQDGLLIVESYYQWYGVLPSVRRVFPHAKMIGIVRDPRDWVRSWMNFASHHDAKDPVSLFGQSRITPKMMGDTKVLHSWDTMTQFEKLCWDWNLIYTLIDDFIHEDDQSRLYKFEDLFGAQTGVNVLADFLMFCTSFRNRSYSYNLQKLDVEKPVNASEKKLPAWQSWDPEKAQILDQYCGDLMRKLGYGLEPEWIAKLDDKSGCDRARA